MTLIRKIKLFLRLGRVPFGLIFGLTLTFVVLWAVETWLLDNPPSVLRGIELVFNLLALATPVAICVVFLKLRRGQQALDLGQRVSATVKGLTLVNSAKDGEPLYVLDRIDADGNLGISLPAASHEFVGLKEGVEIIIYRNTRHDSWWERDILGE